MQCTEAPVLQSKARAKIRDPDTDDVVEGTRKPPNILWRVAAAFMYIIPWIDSIALGREIYHHFPFSIWLFLFPGEVHKGFTHYVSTAEFYVLPLICLHTHLPISNLLIDMSVMSAGPFVGIYYSSQFAPLIVFFLLFLSVVKNTKLHHFVRFNAMQVSNSLQAHCC